MKVITMCFIALSLSTHVDSLDAKMRVHARHALGNADEQSSGPSSSEIERSIYAAPSGGIQQSLGNSTDKDLKTLEDMDAQLMHIAKSANDGTTSPEDRKNLQKFAELIHEQLIKMEGSINASHTHDQNTLNNVVTGFTSCATAKEIRDSEVSGLANSKTSQSQAHKECRIAESKAQKEYADCAGNLDLKKKAKELACKAYEDQDKVPSLDLVEPKPPYPASLSYRSWLGQVYDWVVAQLSSLKNKKSACEKAKIDFDNQKKLCVGADGDSGLKKNHTSQKEICDASQKQLEQTTCSYAEKAESSCTMDGECYDAAKTDYNTTLSSAKVAEEARWQEWGLVKKLMCYCKLFMAGKNMQDSEIQACKDQKDYNVAHLKLTVPALPPGPMPCMANYQKPCTAEYLSTEYGSLPSNAQAASCTACTGGGGGKKQFTVFESKCKHKTDWTYILDYTDVRDKNIDIDDIPNKVEDIAKGFESKNAFYIGNEKLETLDMGKVKEIQVCFGNSKSGKPDCLEGCETLTKDSYVDAGTKCNFPAVGKKGTSEDLIKKVVAGLSGQCSSDATFYNTAQSNGADFPSGAPRARWMTFGRKNFHGQWEGGFHGSGAGPTLWINGRTIYDPGQWPIATKAELAFWNPSERNENAIKGFLWLDTMQIRYKLA